MELQLKFGTALCYCQVFKINKISANYEDFGEKFDHDYDNAPDYGCGDMRFDIKEPTANILNKYNITNGEYFEIAHKLVEGLSFGYCAWCS